MQELSETQARILDSAAQAFMASGFDGASIDDIARNIDQTKGVVYYNFRSKIGIFQAVYERGMLELTTAVSRHVDSAEPGLVRLAAMAREHLSSITKYPAYHDVIRQGVEQRLQSRLTGEQRQELVRLLRHRDAYEDLFTRVIEEGIADGSIRQVPARTAARALIGGLNAVNVWNRYHRPGNGVVQNEEMSESVADVLMHGFTSVQ